MNVEALKKCIRNRQKSIDSVARDMGVNRSTIYRKLQRQGESFTVEEVKKLTESLNLTEKEATDIFFSHESH